MRDTPRHGVRKAFPSPTAIPGARPDSLGRLHYGRATSTRCCRGLRSCRVDARGRRGRRERWLRSSIRDKGPRRAKCRASHRREERRVGKACVRKCKSRWLPDTEQKKKKEKKKTN